MTTRKVALAVVSLGCAALGLLTLGARAAAPVGHFTDNGDGTVRDNLTGLVWQQGFSPAAQTQAASVTYCTTVALAGGGWRLPTILELRSIVDESVSSPSIDQVFFPGTPVEGAWSSSPLAGSSSLGWYVYFPDGVASYYDNLHNYRARCVR